MTKRTLGQLRTQIHTGLLMSNDLGLGGRRALVTGGTKGIGAAVAAPEEPVKQGSSAIKRRFCDVQTAYQASRWLPNSACTNTPLASGVADF
jgi:hypothetical protein